MINPFAPLFAANRVLKLVALFSGQFWTIKSQRCPKRRFQVKLLAAFYCRCKISAFKVRACAECKISWHSSLDFYLSFCLFRFWNSFEDLRIWWKEAKVCSGIRLSSEFSGQPYMAFFLLLRPPWLNRIALILAFFKRSFPLAQVGSQSCPWPLAVMGGSDVQNCSKANNDILYFRADYHVNNFLKFLTWTQNRASAVKWASMVNRALVNRRVLRFKLLVLFK